MIVPSIDIMEGRAVQLREGREFVLDGGDPLERLEAFGVAGEVAVVDLDAALGRGSNKALIREMVRRAPCRVGGGIRSIAAALDWLDAGATRVVIGTSASPAFCSALPKDRVIAAVDARAGSLVLDGWREETGVDVLERIADLAPVVGGFLLTQVEHEGRMRGFSLGLVEAAVGVASGCHVTAAGGITTPDEIAQLDKVGADAQVGMALYTGCLSLGQAVSASLRHPVGEGLWPTVVCDESGIALGLVWSTRDTLAQAIEERRGVYWSRSRNSIWIKGETSGATQELDALRFTVRQAGSGFCHLKTRACWPTMFTLPTLDRIVATRGETPPVGSPRTKPPTCSISPLLPSIRGDRICSS